MAKKGKKPAPQTITASVLARQGKPLSEDHRRKIGLGVKGIYKTKEWREKLSKSHIGLKHTQETKRKVSLHSQAGRPDVREKNRLAHLGHINSKESKLQQSQSMKQRWLDVDYQNRQYIHLLFGNGPNITTTSIAKRVATRTKNGTWNKKGMHTPKAIEKCRQARLHQVFPQKDSKPEKMLQIALSLEGIQYEKHKPILGQPDIFIEPNICVFVDGCYFHGCEICVPAHRLNDPIPSKNLIRDAKVNSELNSQGYQVVRIRQHDITNNVKGVAENIMRLIKSILYKV